MYQIVIKSFILRAGGMKFAMSVQHGKVSSLGERTLLDYSVLRTWQA
jgi:hypothetical protein